MAEDVMTEQFACAIVAVIQHDYDTFAAAAATAVREGRGTAEENAAAFRKSITGRRRQPENHTPKEAGHDQRP